MPAGDDHIPDAEGFDRAWIDAVLPDLAVAGISAAPIGTGQLGDTYRLELRYDGAPQGPQTLVCKIASTDRDAFAMAKGWSLYEREVRFYREIAAGAGISTPRAYATGLAEDGRFFLLMEDIAGAVPGNQLEGIARPRAEQAMGEAARLHASTWGCDGDPALGWLEAGLLAQPFYTAEVFRSSWPVFSDRYADLLTGEQRSVCDGLAELYDAYAAPLDRPRCVTHNDFRPDNMLFAPERMVVVDWQSASFGFNAVDPAYMIGGGFEPEERSAVENGLLDIYYAELMASGVSGYSRDDLAADYRHFAFAGIVVSVCAGVMVKRTERGDAMFMTMLDRHARHALDHDSLAALRTRQAALKG